MICTDEELRLADEWFEKQKLKSNIKYPCKYSFIDGMRQAQKLNTKQTPK